ncbi:hypothetical protein HI914_06706 [Erysiphe necator]|nr:hypothetical protein HI914_06706 [Erysiphe necator]
MIQPSHIRSVYRSILREISIRTASNIFKSTIVKRIRSSFSSNPEVSIQLAEQFLQYQRAQNTYVNLLEKYGSNNEMEEGEKVRLTARRVGMELPVSSMPGQPDGKN